MTRQMGLVPGEVEQLQPEDSRLRGMVVRAENRRFEGATHRRRGAKSNLTHDGPSRRSGITPPLPFYSDDTLMFAAEGIPAEEQRIPLQ